jgi:hypothetical protein
VSKGCLGIAGRQCSVSETGKRATDALDELLERHGKRNGLAVALDAAEIKMRTGELTSLVLVVFVVVGLVGLAIGGPLLALLAS